VPVVGPWSVVLQAPRAQRAREHGHGGRAASYELGPQPNPSPDKKSPHDPAGFPDATASSATESCLLQAKLQGAVGASGGPRTDTDNTRHLTPGPVGLCPVFDSGQFDMPSTCLYMGNTRPGGWRQVRYTAYRPAAG
jgi:hypothetical protein